MLYPELAPVLIVERSGAYFNSAPGKIIQATDGIQRIQDTNGNKIKIFGDTNGTLYQDEQTGVVCDSVSGMCSLVKAIRKRARIRIQNRS